MGERYDDGNATRRPRAARPGIAAARAACIMVALAGVADAAAPAYERDVVPILRTYCAGCHNDADMEGELSVERFASLRKGGAESGDPVVPGDPDASVMLRRIASTAGDHMPPADEPQPSAAEVALLRAWIAAGAAGPPVDASLLESLTVPKLPAYAGRLPVTAAAVTRDGGRAAVVRGRSLDLLDLARAPADDPGAAPVVATLADLPGRVMAVHFGPDDRTLVVAGGVAGLAGVAELRDAATGAVVRTFRGHRDLLTDAELSPDGTILATAGYDRAVKLWNTADGALLRSIDVHNGAVFDLAWHPSGKVLASASADETVKLWRAADGVRLDTLKEPQAEVFAVTFTPDGAHVIAAGRDRRIHLWRLVSLDAPAANPAVHARFAHEAPIVALALAADGSHLLTAAEDRTLFAWSVPGLRRLDDLPTQADLVSVIVAPAAGAAGRFLLGRMDGALTAVGAAEPPHADQTAAGAPPAASVQPAANTADAAAPVSVAEVEPNDEAAAGTVIPVPATVTGAIDKPGDADCFRFTARAGVPLLIDLDAARPGSKVASRLDSRIEVLDAAGAPVERVVLRAVRDSWFTFRGKDSATSDDFRVQNWTEMELDEYLYAGGEVVKLWLYPRGPDSGFKVYPGFGSRHTFFGTTPVTHALGEPAWIVEPLPPGSVPAPNGLPVFRMYHENDDDPARRLGTDSQLIFTPSADGDHTVRVTDVRGFGATADPAAFRYALTVRPARPTFNVAVGGKDAKVSPGSGREVTFTVTRLEGFEGPVRIDVANLPAGFAFHGPLEIEAGQQQALGVLSVTADSMAPDEAASKAVTVTATAEIDGVVVTKPLGDLGTLALAAAPKVTVELLAADGTAAPAGGPLEFAIRPGETIRARVRIARHDQKGPVGFGRDEAGRNLPHGVFVANTGLNGLLIVDGQTEREFFITAAPIAKPGRRVFHLRCEPDGGQCSVPAVLNVLSP
jgi:hypothetical protein